MTRLVNKSIWTRTEIVPLPYVPFSQGDETERAIVDRIANQIIRISKNERRRSGVISKSTDFNFHRSECLAAIDIAGIGTSQVSYLDNLPLVTHMYPFVLINCAVGESALRSLRLHTELKSRGYILPVFPAVPPNDVLHSSTRYGTAFSELVTGKQTHISESSIENLNRLYRMEELVARYPGLSSEGDLVRFEPPVLWLGVDSPELAQGLTCLFNDSTEQFDPDAFRVEFGIGDAELDRYLWTSMLFCKGVNDQGSNDRIGFRLHKNRVFADLMRSTVDVFEREMTERRVIDTTDSDYASFHGRFVEYHEIGRLFDNRDTYALSLLSHVCQKLQRREYSNLRVAVIDNGHERALCDLVPKIFPDSSVVRVMNYFGKPMLSPFAPLSEGDDVVLIADVVNTGRFLSATLEILKAKTRKPVRDVFAFIVDVKANTRDFFEKGLIDSDGRFVHYIKKQLDPVPASTLQRHAQRYSEATPEAYRLFWQTIDQLFQCERAHHETSVRVEDESNRRNAIRLSTLLMHLKPDASQRMGVVSPLYLFLERILRDGGFAAAFFVEPSDRHALRGAIQEIVPDLPVFGATAVDLTEAAAILKQAVKENKSAFVFATAFSTAKALENVVTDIRSEAGGPIAITLAAVLRRYNVMGGTAGVDDTPGMLQKRGIDVACFYASRLPYYLFLEGSSELPQLRNRLNGILGDAVPHASVDDEGPK